jgi:basic amino acid/polyamine antiporter, APA family
MCTTLAFVALAATALIVVRRREATARQELFQSPGYPFTPILFVLLVLGIVVLVAINRPLQAIAGCAVVLLGIPAHGLLAKHQAVGRDMRAGT